MTTVDAALGRARLYSAGGSFDKAAEVLGTALVSNPDEPALLVALARARLGLGDHAAAATSAHAALVQAPDHWDAMRVYAVALDALGRRPEALSVAYRAVQASWQNHLTHYTYASLLLNSGFPAQAMTAAGEAVRLEPGDAENHFLAARILNKLGRIPESTAAYEETLRLDPEYADAAHNIAVNRLNRGHWSRALRGFLGAARMDPELGQHVRRNIGVALIRPLRWVTVVAVILCYSAIVCHARADDPAPRVVTGVIVVLLVAMLVWVTRMVPASARRSVIRAQPMLAVRGGLALCAIVIGVLGVIGVAPGVMLPAAALVLVASLALMVIGWLSGT